MSFTKFHLLTRAEPYFAGDKIEAACGTVILKPVTKGMIEDEPWEIGFWGVCPKCAKATLADQKRYLYVVREALDAEGKMVE